MPDSTAAGPRSSPKETPLSRLIGTTTSLRGQLVRGGVGSLALKVSSMLLGLALAILLARVLGPRDYGVYTQVFALVCLAAVPVQLGLPNVLVRETARAQVAESWGLMRGLWRWTSLAAGVLSLALAVVGLAVAGALRDRLSDLQIATLCWGLVLVPLMALGSLRAAALRGLRRVVLGQLPETVLRPGLLILFVVAVLFMDPGAALTADVAMELHAAAAGLAFAVGAWLLWRLRPAALRDRPAPQYHTRAWMFAALPLALVSGMQLINQYTDVLMIGLFHDATDVGVYRVAVSGATLVAFGLQAINMVASPHFARLYAQRDMERLQRLVTASSRAILVLTLPMVLAMVLGGGFIIHHLFGAEYSEARGALAILALGQFVNGAMGPVGLLLIMTGHERDTARGVGVAAVANVVLNAVLIPSFGIRGAAVATATSTALWNVLLWHAVRRRLGIETMAFAILRHRGRR